MIIKIRFLNWKWINKNVIFILKTSVYKNVIFTYVVKADNESDKRRVGEDVLHKKCSGARIAICENFSPFNFFSSYIYTWMQTVLSSTRHNRPQTMDLFVWLHKLVRWLDLNWLFGEMKLIWLMCEWRGPSLDRG